MTLASSGHDQIVRTCDTDQIPTEVRVAGRERVVGDDRAFRAPDGLELEHAAAVFGGIERDRRVVQLERAVVPNDAAAHA